MMDDTESPTRLVGYHLPAGVGGWSPDVLGTLLGEYHDGWYIVSQHVSSNGQYSKADMQYHANIETNLHSTVVAVLAAWALWDVKL